CACAKHMQTLETGCKRPLEVCIGFDFYAEYCIEGLGVGRWIDRKEARTILKKANEAGLVHQSGGNSMNTECLCNCCPDCCGSMKIFKQIAAPSKISGSNYQAHLSEDDCILCEACIDRCPMGALTISEEVLLLNLQKCIGCGLCTTHCPSGGITLVLKKRAKPIEPPSPENYIFMKPSAEFEKDIKKWVKNT
ncbi:MAG: 4Fe-4S binding protein, partial [Proteobacteria bacterium]|nr:4Fe-4S binding protein [Pseudomonadota bacterium]